MITTAYFGPRSFPEQNEAVGGFVSAIIWGEAGRVKDYCSMAVMEDGRLIAGVVYYHYYPQYGTVELAAGGIKPGWMSRRVLNDIYRMPFEFLACQNTVIRVGSKSTAALRGARHLGGTETVLPRMRGRDEDEHVFTLTDEQWIASRFYKRAFHPS